MTVKELRQRLSQIEKQGHADDIVTVPVTRSSAAVGPHHTVAITGVVIGFDWDSGKTILDGAEPLYAGIENLKAAARFADKVRTALYMKNGFGEKNRNKNANCLADIEAALEAWLPNRDEKKNKGIEESTPK